VPGRVISATICAAMSSRPRVVTLAWVIRSATACGCLKLKLKVEKFCNFRILILRKSGRRLRNATENAHKP